MGKTICANAKTLNESWATVVKACEADAQVATAEAAQLKEKRACIKAFGACRKQERALPSQMNNCMPKCNNAGGSTTPASSASSKNLENAKKIAEAATKALSNLAAALGVSSRALAKRQASDSSGCTEAKGLTESALTAGQGAVANETQTSVDDTK